MKIQKLFIGIIYSLLVLTLNLLWSGAPAIAVAADLDGKTFIVQVGDKGKGADAKDELIFKNGTFRSVGCDRYGFGDGSYAATNGDTTTFEAETTSAKEGSIKWMGTVTGDTIEGTYTWYRSRKWYRLSNTPKEYWFKGELKK